MTESFGDMSLATEETDLQTANLDEHDTPAVDKQETGPREPQTVEKGQTSDSTEQSITKLISQSSDLSPTEKPVAKLMCYQELLRYSKRLQTRPQESSCSKQAFSGDYPWPYEGKALRRGPNRDKKPI